MDDRLAKDLRSITMSKPQFAKTATSIFKFGLIAWVLSFLMGLGLVVSAACVAWHFISKYW